MKRALLQKARMIDGLTVGADPELFLVDDNGVFVSGHDAIPGTKRQPFLVNRGAVQVDGVACEFNIDPCRTQQQFVENITTVRSTLDLMIQKSKGGLLRTTPVPTAIFDAKYFASLPTEARALGCEPDFNAWNGGKRNPKPHTKLPMRTGAGHIHLGWTETDPSPRNHAHMFDCITLTKQLDAALFIPSHAWDPDTQRRSLYGAMGAFRPKFFGLEYRVLSNAWLADPAWIGWVFDAAQQAWRLLEAGYHLYKHPKFQAMKDQPVTPDVIKSYEEVLLAREFRMIPTLGGWRTA